MLKRLTCALLRHVHPQELTRGDGFYAARCTRCGKLLLVSLPCEEYRDESMHYCGDVMCARIPDPDGGGDVCDQAVRCRLLLIDAHRKAGLRMPKAVR